MYTSSLRNVYRLAFEVLARRFDTRTAAVCLTAAYLVFGARDRVFDAPSTLAALEALRDLPPDATPPELALVTPMGPMLLGPLPKLTIERLTLGGEERVTGMIPGLFRAIRPLYGVPAVPAVSVTAGTDALVAQLAEVARIMRGPSA